MRYINDLAPHTSEWDFLSQCSNETKSGRDYFVDRCSHLERLFQRLGLPLIEFYWFTYDDELELELKVDFEKFDNFMNFSPLIKKFLTKYFPIKDRECFENIQIVNLDDDLGYDWKSYIRAYRNEFIKLRLRVDSHAPNYYFASPIYLDACLNYA